MSEFKAGDRVKVHLPESGWHGKTGTIEEDDPAWPAADEGYDYWVWLDGRGLWANGPFAFTNDELRPLGEES